MNIINICKMNGPFIDCMIGPGQNGLLPTTNWHTLLSSIADSTRTIAWYIWSPKVSEICLSVTIFLQKQCLI